MPQIRETDFEIVKEADNYTLIKFYRNPNLGFNFEVEVFIPTCTRDNANLLVTFDNNPAKIELLLEKIGAPMMRPRVKAVEDANGNEINFEQFDPRGILNETGETVEYIDPEFKGEQCSSTIIEQYRAAIDTIYAYLKRVGKIAEDKPEKVDVEGYSYQGVIAQRMGMLLPDKIRSVICGGAISSIPIPRQSYMGVKLPYPAGIENIEAILGITPEEYIEQYRNVIQILYATEEELKYDGNYTDLGERVERDENGNKIDRTKITVSQHDISPEVVDIVIAQREIFGDDLNERVMGAIELCEETGCAIKKFKIYKGTGHHISDMDICRQTVVDMCDAIISMDEVEAAINPQTVEIRGYELDVDAFGNPIVRIDTSYEERRSGIQTRLAKAQTDEEYNNFIDEILIELATDPETCRKFLFITEMGNGAQKVFINELSPERIRKAIELVRESKQGRTQVLAMETLKIEQGDSDGKARVTAEMERHGRLLPEEVKVIGG